MRLPLLWPLLTSAAPSRPVARAVVRCSGRSRRSLEVRHAFFSRTRRIYRDGVANDNWAFPSLAGLPTPHWPDIRHSPQQPDCFLFVVSEISSLAFFRSRLATGTLA